MRAPLILATLSLAVATSAGAFSLSSPTVKDGGTLPKDHEFEGFGCMGGNLSPALSWSDAPEGTKSFAVTVYDPDAPTGSGWWHWTLVNIPADVSVLPVGLGKKPGAQLPQGAVQGRNDYGYAGFGGACPPPGDEPHRYIFTIWALSVETLSVDENSSGALVGYNLNANVIEKATLTATYGR